MSDAPLTVQGIQETLNKYGVQLDMTQDGRIKVGQKTTGEDIWVSDQDLAEAQLFERSSGSMSGDTVVELVLYGVKHELYRKFEFGDA